LPKQEKENDGIEASSPSQENQPLPQAIPKQQQKNQIQTKVPDEVKQTTGI
jgi:hypothetical protein